MIRIRWRIRGRRRLLLRGRRDGADALDREPIDLTGDRFAPHLRIGSIHGGIMVRQWVRCRRAITSIASTVD